MHGAPLFAQPWWVNLLIFVPFVAYAFFRKGLAIPAGKLVTTAVFGAAMGFVESAVVVYLRVATGLYPGGPEPAATAQVVSELSRRLLTIEIFREMATIVMLVCVALLTAKPRRERWAIFLWTFAFWDVIYYAGLRITIGWPTSLKTLDVLFLIPTPWFAEVWFPVLVSVLCMLAVIAGKVSRPACRTSNQASPAELRGEP